MSAPHGRGQKPQSRAGWPGCFCRGTGSVHLVSTGRPQNVKISELRGLTRQEAYPHDIANRNLANRSLAHCYMTNARFSSSCSRTGRAHPAISTLLAASRAAAGETP